jgi:glycerol-3-phosphate cytidylyltransferase-like family protein
MAHHYGDFMKKPKYIVVSGGFDPVHIGHVRMFKEASKYRRMASTQKGICIYAF